MELRSNLRISQNAAPVTGVNRIGMGIEEEADPVARVKPGSVGALDVGSSIGCGVGRLLGRGGSGTWFRTGGVEGAGASAMAA